MITQLRKRDGRIVTFEKTKIEDAIYKAASAVGGRDRKTASALADEVIKDIALLEKPNWIPTVEEIQDVVEKVLIESGHAKTAKAYILYRQRRAELREEKKRILEKEIIDEVDKNFDLNALRVLKARYLRKDEDGKLIETPKYLFTRVAVHTALPDILYDERVFDAEGKNMPHSVEQFAFEHVSVGEYPLNKYHLEALKRMYDRFNACGQMKVPWSQLLQMMKNHELHEYGKNIEQYFSAMVSKKFLPNTPAIANFGNVLGMGSACFHPDQLILASNGPKKISEIDVGDEVLTHKGRFRKVKEVFIRETSSLLSFECRKLPKPSMLLTDEHPVLAFKNNEIGWYPAYTIKEGNSVALSYPAETTDVEKIMVSDTVEGVIVKGGECYYEYSGGKFNAFVHTTKPVKDTIEVDYDLMKVFGFYLSEGNVSNSDCVRFTLSSEELDYCKEIVSIMKRKFGVTARIETNKNPERKWLHLRFHSTILAKFFENIFGTGYSKKRIPGWIMKLPAEKQKGIMSGMIRGDGTIFRNWEKINARLVMSNTNLVYAFWQMCMRCGVFPALGKESMPKLGHVQPTRCTLGDAKGQLLMNELFAKTIQETIGEDKTFVVNGIVFTEVEKIEKIDYSGPVYNLEVEEDHSYVANMVSVHNCFVLGIEDNMESIMDTLKYTAIIHKSGGGTGFNFSKLRPEGDYVSSTSGVASGPMSFMRLFDTMTEVVKQGGIRRGANMGILNSNHPDIEKFIKSKEGNKALRNFNISVLIMQDFWSYYEKNEPYPLVNPRTGEVMRTVNPRMLFDMIVYQAWESAEPGVIFYDTVNRYNPFLKSLGPIVTTNPCVSSDTLVSTERGLERIDSVQSENILVDKRTIGSGSLLHYGCEFVKPLQIVKTGEKDCYKIETKSGYEITATPDHKILTTNGWKELLEITEDDHLLIQSGEGKFNSDPKIPFTVKNEIIGRNGRKYNLNLPSEWSRELGLLLGWLTGDGWLNSKYSQIGLVFAKEDEEAKKIIQPIFERYCNREIKEIDYPNGCVQLRSASKFVVDFFRNLGIKDANEKREVPKALFTATEDAVIGFLEGLFSSDGTIGAGTESRNYIRLNSSSAKLLKQVQLLLLNLGIKSSIYDRSTKNKIFRYTNKNGEIIKYKTSGVNYELNVSKQNLAKLIQLMSFVQSRNKGKTEKLKAFEFYKETFVEKVKSKEYVGKKEVWDITEPMTHSFIANGIIVHNCGEVLLYPNEPCNLGSINVWAFAKEDDNGNVYYDWDGLKETVVLATKFLDNVIDVNRFPLKQIEEMSLRTRKIGLGVMGVGDLLFELGIPYNSEDGRKFMEKLMEFINYYSKFTSVEMAGRRGALPFYENSFYPEGRLPIMGFDTKGDWNLDWTAISEGAKKGIRNGFTIVIAPTGSISMIAGCSSGIEPVYSLVFEKNVKVGSFYYIDPVFEKFMRREGIYDEDLMAEINANHGSLQNIPYIPRKLKEVFVTAMDIKPEDHIRALASFQKWTDSSISKTINFPANATVEDMRQSYMLAYKLGCKDVTVYRDNSIQDQVLNAPKTAAASKDNNMAIDFLHQQKGDTGAEKGIIKSCPSCSTELKKKDGCLTCPECGWGLCSA